MSNLMASLMAATCKQFSRHVASSQAAEGGLYWRIQFWTHWMICEFCRRYWKELKVIGQQHRDNNKHVVSMQNLSAIKLRLRERLKDL